MLINLISIPILLDLLGKDAYGIQRLVTIIIGYFTIMDMGLDLPIIKFVSEYKSTGKDDLLQKLLNTIILLYLIVGLFGLLIMILLSKYFALYVFNIPVYLQKDSIWVFYIASFGFFASFGMSWGRALFKGLQKYHITYIVTTFNQGAGIIFGIAAILYGYGIVGFVFVRVFTTFISVLIYYVFAKRYVPISFKPKFDLGIFITIREFVSYGIINRVSGAILSRLDVTIIGIILGVGAVGIYSIPFMIATQLGYMIALAIGFVFPLTSELLAKYEFEKTQSIFNYINNFLIIFTGVVFVPLFIFGDSFLYLWVKDISKETGPILKVLTIYAFIGSSTTTISNNITLGFGKIKYFTLFNLVKNIIAGICIYFLIKKYGIIGAPIALVITELLGIPYWIYCVKNILQLPVFLTVYRSFYPLLIIVLIGFVFNYFVVFISSWLSLISVVIIFLFTVFSVSWFFLLNSKLKILIKNILLDMLNKKNIIQS